MTNTAAAVTVYLSSLLVTNWVKTHDLTPAKVESIYADYQPAMVREYGLVFREHWVQFPMGSNYVISKQYVTNAGSRIVTNTPPAMVNAIFTNMTGNIFWIDDKNNWGTNQFR